MKTKLSWGVAAITILVAAPTLAFVGCGSEDAETIVGQDDGGEASASSSSGAASSSGGTSTSSGGSSGTSSGDAGSDATSLLDGQVCLLVGQACGLSSDCCTKICNKALGATVGECAPPPVGGGCLAPNADCTVGTECCTNACVGNKCSATQCKADTPVAETCTSNGECCSGKCDLGGTGKCTAIAGGTCRTEGNPCAQNTDCCSQQCDASKHCSNASYCTQNGDSCAGDAECCGGNCDKAAGATLGRCSAVPGHTCKPAGTVCTTNGCDNQCCSLSCGPLGMSGVNVCQPPSGCRPQNEICSADGDCCGGPGRPTGRKSGDTIGEMNDPKQCLKADAGETYGRCESPNVMANSCLRPGDVCQANDGNDCGGTSNNCCESVYPDGGLPGPSFCNNNPTQCCSRDSLGIPRCRAVNFLCVDGGTVPPGQACATSADCCGKPCVSNKCEGACVPKGGTCTINADCCAPEPCVVPTGGTLGICGGVLQPDGGVTPPPDGGTTTDGGTCALYGQNCTGAGQCCNGVPCSGGFCRFN